jgi:hypothetical protein
LAARFSARRSLSVFCGFFFSWCFGLSELWLIERIVTHSLEASYRWRLPRDPLKADTEPRVAIYRLHDTTGDDLGLLEHPAPNLEPGDVVVVADGREAIVTARVEAEPGWGELIALLEVAIAPTPLTSDESIA